MFQKNIIECVELIDAIRKNQELIATHESRFISTQEPMYREKSLHILAYDIIYSSRAYGFYGEDFIKQSSKERKLHEERYQKAKELQSAYEKARIDFDMLEELKKYLNSIIQVGDTVTHKQFGQGTIMSIEEDHYRIQFGGNHGIKKIGIFFPLSKGILKPDLKNFEQFIQKYSVVITQMNLIPIRLKNAEKALEPYLDYLE